MLESTEAFGRQLAAKMWGDMPKSLSGFCPKTVRWYSKEAFISCVLEQIHRRLKQELLSPVDHTFKMVFDGRIENYDEYGFLSADAAVKSFKDLAKKWRWAAKTEVTSEQYPETGENSVFVTITFKLRT